jgi:hypothetical protein
MSIASLDELAQFKTGGFPAEYPANQRTFFSPIDKVHEALLALVSGAVHSLVLSMYGYDDDDLDKAIRSKIADEKVYVQMNLDKSQAAGKHEKQILAEWGNDQAAASIAVGDSAKHAISHLKLLIVDGLDVVTGSTNWSASGEGLQDNQATITRDAVFAAECRSRLDAVHDSMLKQMAAAK